MRVAAMDRCSLLGAPLLRPVAALLLSVGVLVILLPAALTFCWLLTLGMAPHTYVWAGWHFDSSASFDHSWQTYATDAIVSAVCSYYMFLLCRTVQPSALRCRILALLALYNISTAVGALAHYGHDGSYTTLNTAAFRVAWTIVVGCTAVAGAVQGSIGSELLRLHAIACEGRLPGVPFLPELAWLGWAVTFLVFVLLGCLSCTAPASDIFIAGASQALPTFYLQAVLLTCRTGTPTFAWCLLELGLLGMAPTIFVYPWLVQKSGLGDGSINALLHIVLALSWGVQGFGLVTVCKGLEGATSPDSEGDSRPCGITMKFSASSDDGSGRTLAFPVDTVPNKCKVN